MAIRPLTILEDENVFVKLYNKIQLNLTSNSNILHCPLVQKDVNGFSTYGYDNIENLIKNKYELYIIDGPFGSDRYSRYDMYNIAKTLQPSDEFIILFDDTHRKGEEETINSIIHLLEEQHNERTEHVTEELVLYCFLGVFIIFVVDSFARAGKYTR